MQTPETVLNSYYLETRCQLLEIAAMLDRYDRAQNSGAAPRSDQRIDLLHESLSMLSKQESSTDRCERLLNLFSDPQ